MKNRLSDLNDHLFAQLERLGEEELTPEKIESEVKRAEAIVSVSSQIVSNAMTQMKAAALLAEHGEKIRAHMPAIAGPASKAIP